MNPLQERHLDLTRRRFFRVAAGGLSGALGTVALGSALGARSPGRAGDARGTRGVHHRPQWGYVVAGSALLGVGMGRRLVTLLVGTAPQSSPAAAPEAAPETEGDV